MSDTLPDLEKRLRALADALPYDPDMARRVLARIAADRIRPRPARPTHLRRIIMKSSLGIAAAAGLAIGAWSILGNPRPTFAVPDVTDRLRSLHSLHLRGVIAASQNGGGAHDIEVYLREPDCLRVNGMTVNDNGKITLREMAYAPDRFTMINRTDKTVMTVTVPAGSARPEDQRVLVASQLQGFLQMMFGPERSKADFHRVRSEKVGGVSTDVYECPMGEAGTATVWFDPATRLPVRTALGPVRFDTIEADPAIPEAVFHPDVPVGYAVARPTTAPVGDPDAAAEGPGGCTFDGVHLCVRHLLALPDGDVLACWCLYQADKRGADLTLPGERVKLTIKSQHGAAYAERLLHADATAGGWHWRWSLLRPPAAPQAGAFVMLTFGAGLGRSSGVETQVPLSYSPAELAERVATLQRQPLPPGAMPMTLEAIRAGDKAR